LLRRYARVVDHIAARDVAQGAPLEGGSTLHPILQNINICIINQNCHHMQWLVLCSATRTFQYVQHLV